MNQPVLRKEPDCLLAGRGNVVSLSVPRPAQSKGLCGGAAGLSSITAQHGLP